MLTNYTAPGRAILDGIGIVTRDAGIRPSQLDIVIHGATLATHAPIERRGPPTALVTAEGFRDVIETRTETGSSDMVSTCAFPRP